MRLRPGGSRCRGTGPALAALILALSLVGPAVRAPLARAASTCLGMPVTIIGSQEDDTIEGTSGPDVIGGEGGNDVIDGGGGDDRICGGSGDDTLDGGRGADRCDGGAGHDRADCESTSSVP